MRQTRNLGVYEFVVMAVATTFGFLGAPLWITPAAGLLLALSTFREYAGLQPRLIRAGGARLIAGAAVMTVLTCLLFTSLCFGVGRGIRWLLSA